MIAKYFIKTFGCQMNTSDSERIAGFLDSIGFYQSDAIEKSNLVFFNTCGIRQMAENRAYSTIHTLHKKYPEIKIILTGCLSDRLDVQKRLKNKVNLFFPINNFTELENWIAKNFFQKQSKPKILTQENINYLTIHSKSSNTFHALVPIMTGCNNFCSYCVVPYARGREISRSPEEIITEIKKALENGAKEITLLGQNVNSYQFNQTDFPTLLKTIEALPEYFWLRFISSHPKDFSDKLIKTITNSKKICEHIHLPIQSGSDEILSKMNRHYTFNHYENLIKKICSAFDKYKPNKPYSLTSDIIVGFPGETKKQFLESAKVMKKIGYDMVYFGQFSPRPGTVAEKMNDNVSQKEKKAREKFLNDILTKTTFAKNKKYIGKEMEVLIDKQKDNFYFGRTRTGKNVKIKFSCKKTFQDFVKVKITKANIWNLEGKIIK